MELAAQIIGIFAMAMNVLSYQMKDKNKLIFMQLFGSLLFSANYLMLGAIMGGIMNIMAVIRAIVYINIDKMKLNRNIVAALFIGAFVASYVIAFTLLGTEPTPRNLIIEALPIIGMSAVTISFGMTNAARVRLMGITVNSPGWLVYNICSGSIGAILCEVFSLISLALGIIRHDIKWKKKKAAKSNSKSENQE